MNVGYLSAKNCSHIQSFISVLSVCKQVKEMSHLRNFHLLQRKKFSSVWIQMSSSNLIYYRPRYRVKLNYGVVK